MKVGLVVHSGRDDSLRAASAAAERLNQLDADVIAADEGPSPTAVGVPLAAGDSFAHGLDVVLSFGGDGTLLRAAHLCRDADVPVLGVNLGRVGFLADVEHDELDRALAAVVRGDLEVERRPTLGLRARDADGNDIARDWALNDVSVEKTARQRVLLMDVHLGDTMFATVPADALVVATPTGSTAYAFSAGGPILSPSVRATLVTPVAAHSVFSRTVVVAEDEVVRVEILADQADAVVSCDGRPPTTVPAGGSVSVVGGGRPVRLARFAPRNFYDLVRTKFGLR